MVKNEKNRIHAYHLENLNNLSSLKEFPEIRHLILFGSHATGKFTTLSDIDIAFFSNKPLSFAEESDLLYLLNRLVGSEEIDLVNFENASIPIKYKILSEGKIIFSRDLAEIADLKEMIIPLYFDFVYYNYEYRQVFQNILRGI